MEQSKIRDELNKKAPEYVLNDRRKGADWILKIINFVGYAIWAFLLIVFSICETAGLKWGNLGEITTAGLNTGLIRVAITLTVILFIVSAILLIMSSKRTRRRTDKIKISLLISEIVSFVFGVLLLAKFHLG